MTNLTTLPFNELHLSPKNVRATENAVGIDALAKSILAQGLLQNLVVTAGDHAVVAGGRRYRALAMLVSEGKIAADAQVPVRIVDQQESTSASLTENISREAMHPADEFAAFQRLTTEGWSIDRIADAFSVTPLVVERRLRLAEAAPALMVEFKNSQITTDQLIALCSTDDHERQVSVWQRLKGRS
jgi:ParB family chromosome partitioning protein